MDGRSVRQLPWLLASTFGAALLLAIAGHRLFLAQRADILAHRSEALAAIADLKLQELGRWRRERLVDARVAADIPFLADALAGLRPGDPDELTRGTLVALLDSFRRHKQYRGAAILEPSGAILVARGIGAGDLEQHIRETLAGRAPIVDPFFTDLHPSALGTESHLGIFQPLGRGYRLFLLVDPAVDLFPIVKHWPTPSPSGEVLIVRRDGGDVVYLNELRHRAGAPLRIPATRAELPAARALTGFEGVMEGVDYRGIDVLAVTRRVPGTSWFMVAKVDRAEVLDTIQERGRTVAVLGALMWLLATAALLLLRHQQRLAHYRQLLAESERHREELGRAAEVLHAEEAQRRRDLERLESIVALSQRTGLSTSELLNEALEEALALTGSGYGYLYHYDEERRHFTLNSWSRDVRPGCAVAGPLAMYGLDEAGLWGEAVRKRHEILVNDFAARPPLKRGFPEGHVPLRNFLSIPVFAGTQIVAVLWVANKDGDYTAGDVAQLKLLMSETWRVVERQGALEELRHTVAELRRSNDELEQFAYIASHDLQEPLRSISSFLQLIERRFRDRLDDDGREFIAFAVEGANHLQRMIEGLLEYSKIGRRPPAPATVDLGLALDQALAQLAVAIREAGAVVSSDPLPTVSGDERQFVRLFQNLVANAVKFHGDSPPHIHVSSEPDVTGVVVRVRDNGVGIAPEYQQRIFDIFRRLHGPEVPGAGIGLSLCRRIVECAGGRIWVESNQGMGATFSFTLPDSKGENP